MSFRLPEKSARPGSGSGPETDIDFHAMGLSFAIRPDGEIRLRRRLGNEFAPDTVLARQTSALACASEVPPMFED